MQQIYSIYIYLFIFIETEREKRNKRKNKQNIGVVTILELGEKFIVQQSE